MQHKVRAFTLTELLITLALVALLFNLGLPHMFAAVQKHTGEAMVNNLARSMSFARAAAVSTGRMVTMCRSRDGTGCGGQWLDGILVFTDGNVERKPNGGGRILRYLQHGKTAGSLRLRSFPNRQYVQFSGLGFTNRQNGNFTWCPPDGDAALAQQLVFTQSGRARVALDLDGDGIREDSQGKPLSCVD